MTLAIPIFIIYNVGGAGLLTFSQGVYFNYTARDLLGLLPAFGLQLFLFLACTSIGVCFYSSSKNPNGFMHWHSFLISHFFLWQYYITFFRPSYLYSILTLSILCQPLPTLPTFPLAKSTAY